MYTIEAIYIFKCSKFKANKQDIFTMLNEALRGANVHTMWSFWKLINLADQDSRNLPNTF